MSETAERTVRRGVTSVAGRLAVLLGGIATISTGLALVLQDRALDQDLRGNARDRLAASARAADQLVAEHLRNLAGRYGAISRTPELRANLTTGHAETVSFYATRLLRDQGATMIAFLDAEGGLLTAAGDPRLIDAAREAALRTGTETPECVGTREAGAEAAWGACAYPYGPAESSLFSVDDDLYAAVAVPLRSGRALDGGLLAVEAIEPEQISRWSGLTGARVSTAPLALGEDGLSAAVRRLPGVELRVSTTYEVERATIRRARANLVASGVLALLLALGASLLMARAFARPIVEIREATARLSEGDLGSRVEVDRDDELGQLGDAFNELASQLTASQERVRRAQRLARFGSWYFDFETRTFEGTAEFRRLFGLDPEGPVPLDLLLLRIRPGDRKAFDATMRESRHRSAPFRLDLRVLAGGGRDRILHVRGHARNRTASRLEGSVQDVTERRQAEEQIHYLARHDPLTGLGNRDQAMEDLGRRLAARDRAHGLALVVVGIDDLQGVTDTFGHAVGDRILIEFARRLVSNVRREARGGLEHPDTVARLGDERFVALLEGADGPDDAARAAERLLTTVRGVYRVGENEIAVSASAGVALWPRDGDEPDALIRNGETALTRAQKETPGGTRFFHESMQTDATRRLQLATRLRRAVREGGLELHYQPRIHPGTGGLIGFEGLARWTDPEMGAISPGEFIPIAEATGSIRALGAWCIETAAEQLRAWHAAGHTGLSVSVNLSRQQLQPRLVEHVVACTEGIEPSSFELEVTESALIEEGDAAIETLTALRAHGFRIALDDFGTGYSSLSYLQGLPIDTVKVDRSFIQDIADDPDAAALTGSVLAMCRALRLHSVVEGVETKAQLDVLVELGYEEVQGFYFSRPLPAADADGYIESAPRAPERSHA